MVTAGIAEGYRRIGVEADEVALTHREREVLWLVAQGKSNKEIGRVLGISICTVKIHLSNVFSKLGVSRRTDAVTVGRQQGEIRPPMHLVRS